MKRLLSFILLTLFLGLPRLGLCGEVGRLSDATQACLSCHESVTPGVVEDWKTSRHSVVTPAEGLAAKDAARLVSAENPPEATREFVVGCAECHAQASGERKDFFEHNGFQIHTVVSPGDCASCHATEASQYSENIMAHAHGNLADNALYGQLVDAVNGTPTFDKGKTGLTPPNAATNADSCYYCHGTRVEAGPLEKRETAMGEMEFPKLSNWPNQGVGRLNPDGSMGSCTPCHPRHAFSMATARKPYVCKECHDGPDVPAFKVYSTSKHGNMFSAEGHDWNFKTTPWTVGTDFTAPTCAACHVSLLAAPDGTILAKRSHAMSDRLSWRIFGPLYAVAQPKSPNTAVIRNKAGLQLPADLDGTPASDFLINAEEMAARRATMRGICQACHARDWVAGFYGRLDNTVSETNAKVRAATDLMREAWNAGLAEGPGKGNPFDEHPENIWTEIWLFSAHSVRYSTAMGGGGDYGAFADGRIFLNMQIRQLADWMKSRRR